MSDDTADFGRVVVTARVAKTTQLEHPVDVVGYATVYGGAAIGRYAYINVGIVVYSNVSIGRFFSVSRQVGEDSKAPSGPP